MSYQWGHDDDIVLERISPEDGKLTAWPHEIGIILRDGKITDVFTEETRSTRKGMFSSDAETLKAYTWPFTVQLYLQPWDTSQPDNGVALADTVLTSDREPVTAQIGITFSVIKEEVERLLGLLRSRLAITKHDVAQEIKGELLAKVLAPDLQRHTASDLRGNRELLQGIYASLETELASTISRCGLKLDNFYVNWGLTVEERERIKEQQHEATLREIERRREVQDAQNQGAATKAQPKPEPEPANQPYRASGNSGVPPQRTSVGAAPTGEPEPEQTPLPADRPSVAAENNWAPTPHYFASNYPADKGTLHKRFFQELIAKLEQQRFTGRRKAGPDNWMTFPSGVAAITYYAWMASRENEARVVLVLEHVDGERNKRLFDRLAAHRERIESELATSLRWERKDSFKSCHISIVLTNRNIYADANELEEVQNWMAKWLLAFRQVFGWWLPRMDLSDFYR